MGFLDTLSSSSSDDSEDATSPFGVTIAPNDPNAEGDKNRMDVRAAYGFTKAPAGTGSGATFSATTRRRQMGMGRED